MLGTTDLHGNVFNWDYFKNAEFDDTAHNDIGLAKVSTLIKAVAGRARAASRVLTLDAGDTIQGTPLAYYYAKIEPITGGVIHPMARAMNLIGYDAAALGNHEFNYGIALLRTFESQLQLPAARRQRGRPGDQAAGLPAVHHQEVQGRPDGADLKVGILGLTNPGIAIWDKANVEGKMEFPGLVEQAKKFVPELKAARLRRRRGLGALRRGHVLVVRRRAAVPRERRRAGRRAGARHRRDPGRPRAHGDPAALRHQHEDRQAGAALPSRSSGASGVAVMDFDLEQVDGRWQVVRSARSQVLNSNTVAGRPGGRRPRCRQQHDTVVAYVNSVDRHLDRGDVRRTAPSSRTSPIIDFVNYVQADAVKAGLTGRRRAAGALDRRAVQPGGVVPGRAT